MTQPIKKRNRVPASCFNCRKRKTKCDKSRPHCTRCIVDEITEMCIYEEGKSASVSSHTNGKHELRTKKDSTESNLMKGVSSPSSLETLNSRIRELELLVKNKSQQYNDTISVISGSSVDTRVTPSSTSETPSDASFTFERSSGYIMVEGKISYIGLTNYLCIVLEDPDASGVFTSYMEDQVRMVRENPKRFKVSCNPSNYLPSKDSISKNAFADVNKLPPLKDIKYLFDRFFKIFHPFAPFIDRAVVEPELYLLLIDKSTHCVWNPSKVYETSLIGMLLIILRISYLTYHSRGNDKKSDLIIPKSYIECATNLLVSLQSFTVYSMSKVHALLLLLVYRRFCPESDDSTRDTSELLLIVIQAAKKFGLDRRSPYFSTVFVSEKEAYNWRLTWIYICYFDADISYNDGLSTVLDNYDLKDTDLLDFVLYYRPGVIRIVEQMSTVFKTISSFTRRSIRDRVVNRLEVEGAISVINDILYSRTRSFQQLCHRINPEAKDDDTIDKLLEFSIRVDLHYQAYSLWMLLYLSIDDTVDHTKTVEKHDYLTLALEKMLVILRICHGFLKDNNSYFGVELNAFMSSRVFLCLKKISGCISTTATRFYSNNYSLVEELFKFSSADSMGLSKWANITNNDKQSLKNILNILKEVYVMAETYASNIYSSYKLCIQVKFILIYINEKYPDLFASESSDINMASQNDVNTFSEIFKVHDYQPFWNDQMAISSFFNTDIFVQGLGDEFSSMLDEEMTI